MSNLDYARGKQRSDRDRRLLKRSPVGTINPQWFRGPRTRVQGEGWAQANYLQMAGREGFEPSRELYTPSPLSRRVLSTTQPPPRRGRVCRFYRPQPLSILSTRWKHRVDQARPRCGVLDARWRSERRPPREASSGTRLPTEPSARSSFPFSTASHSMSSVSSSRPAALHRWMTRPTVSTPSRGSALAFPRFEWGPKPTRNGL